MQIAKAQIQSGKVTYKIKPINLEDFISPLQDLESLKNSDSYKSVSRIVPHVAMQLYFTKEESFMEVAEQMPLNKRDVIIEFNSTMRMAGSIGIYYANTKEDLFLRQVNGELISSSFNNPNLLEWEIQEETKEIHGYTCIKATSTLITPSNDIPVIAWFTPELPFPFGPQQVRGLPGLILEMKYRKGYNYYVEAIELYPTPINITRPNKGKKTTWEKYILDNLLEDLSFRKSRGFKDKMTEETEIRYKTLLEKLTSK